MENQVSEHVFKLKVSEVIAADQSHQTSGTLTNWNLLQEKLWSLKADIEHFIRNPELGRPSNFDLAVSIATKVDSQAKQMTERQKERQELARARARSRSLKRRPAILEGGRADGNG